MTAPERPRISPGEVEVMLAFWYDPYADERPWTRGQREFISQLETYGVLGRDFSGRLVGDSDALKPYINAICAVPLPVKQWVLP